MNHMINLKRNCPICGSTGGSFLNEIDMAQEKRSCLPSHYDIVCCPNCGFCFADMQASQDDFDNYYMTSNNYSEAEGLRTSTPYEITYESVYRLIEDRVNRHMKIIDIGSGGGGLLRFLKAHGYENVHGLDPSKASIDCLKSFGIEGKVGSIFGSVADEDQNAYDLVISTAVVEHIYDLNSYVQRLMKYLKPDGYLLINAPAVESFQENILPKPRYFNQEHINYFSQISLQNLFAKYGVSCVSNTIALNEGEKELFYLGKVDGILASPIVDELAENSIRNYLVAWEKQESDTEQKVNRATKTKRKIVIWGGGQYAMQLLKKHPEFAEKVAYIVDGNSMRWGHYIAEKEICSPKRLLQDEENPLICICSMMNSQDILQELKECNRSQNAMVM